MIYILFQVNQDPLIIPRDAFGMEIHQFLSSQSFFIHEIDVLSVILDSDPVETIIVQEPYDPPILYLDIFAQTIMFLMIVYSVIFGSSVQQKD